MSRITVTRLIVYLSQEPERIVDPPPLLVDIAAANPRVVLNTRPDRWSEELKGKYRADPNWKLRAQLYCGLLVHPALTQFLMHITAGTRVLICCQELRGRIATLIDNVCEISWIPSTMAGQTGVHAQILLETENAYGAIGGRVWGNYILAISEMSRSVRAKNVCDPRGEKFAAALGWYDAL